MRLDIDGKPYGLFPVIHGSELMRVKMFPERTATRLKVDDIDRMGFDKALLPEVSWEVELKKDEHGVLKTLDVQSGRKTRYGRVHNQYLVQWKGSSDPTWIDEEDLNCGSLLQEFDRDRVSKNRFELMQSHEAAVGE